jgi:phosphoserine phosphatase RsbU/P
VLVGDVSQDPRYINVVPDVRSELAIPLLLKDRCIGVVDLESPELDAFSKRDVEILTLLASQAAVAIENARLYEEVRANEERLEKELRFAQRVQTALLPLGPPKRMKGIDVAARFAPARELGGDFHDFLSPTRTPSSSRSATSRARGCPAALYSAFAAELCAAARSGAATRRIARARPACCRRSTRSCTSGSSRSTTARSATPNFDLKRRSMTLANSGLPYPIRCSAEGCAPSSCPGSRSARFPGSTYDEISYPLAAGDIYVFCTDGVYEALSPTARSSRRHPRDRGHRAGARPAGAVSWARSANAVQLWRGEAPPNDDMTAVVVRVTA